MTLPRATDGALVQNPLRILHRPPRGGPGGRSQGRGEALAVGELEGGMSGVGRPRIDREHMPPGAEEPTEWLRWRKRGTTAATWFIAPRAGAVVVTKEGEYELPSRWEGWIALDPDGDPYPIEASVFERTYELAREGSEKRP